jgi:two-component system, LuxR family, response regulator FixJ
VPQRPPVVAIVDDDASLRSALARLLRTAGWQTVTFDSAEAFLHTDPQMPIDCLMLDVWLPGMSGVALLEHLGTLGSPLPVIIITGRDDVQMRLRTAQLGAVAYLHKPLDEQDLLLALQRALERTASKKAPEG